MKFPTLTLGFAGIAALVSLGTASAVETKLCSPLEAAVNKAITAAPESVLKVVAEQVAASPKCACEIVKAAISASKADSAMVVAIVEASAAAAPGQLPVVLACAATVAPKAAAALADKFGSETAGSGKGVVGKESVGKAPMMAPPVEEEYSEDFGFVRPGIGGIYLTIPNGSRSGTGQAFSQKEIERLLKTGNFRLINGQLVEIIETIVTKPGRPVRPPTDLSPGTPAPISSNG